MRDLHERGGDTLAWAEAAAGTLDAGSVLRSELARWRLRAQREGVAPKEPTGDTMSGGGRPRAQSRAF